MRVLFIVLATALCTAVATLAAVEAERNPALAGTLSKAVHQEHYCQAPEISNEYDDIYRASVRLYFPPRFNTDDEWCWEKSNAVVESGQDPEAVSPVGAMGVLQLMPATFEEITGRYGIQAEATDARVNIQMGVAHQSAMYKALFDNRTKECHRACGHAVYNCGLGCFIDAQVKADGAMCLDAIGEHLPKETRDYHPKIALVHESLTGA